MAKKSSKPNKMASAMAVGLDYPSTASYKQSAEDKARQERYRAEEALRTLTRAQEIQRDRGLMRNVKTLAREQVKVTSAVAGLGKSKSRGR